MLKKWPVYLTFYKQTLIYSLAAGLAMVLITYPGLTYIQKLNIRLFAFVFVGLLIYFIINESNKSNDTFFYLNQGLTKLQLYAFSLVSNLILPFVIYMLLK